MLRICLALATLIGCECGERASPDPAEPIEQPASRRWATQGNAERGRALVNQYECARCHDGLADVEQPPIEQHCVRCHQSILDGSTEAEVPPEVLARWRGNLHSLNAAPSLTATDGRLSRDFVAAFLLAPADQRPNLPAMMPRLALSESQASDIATYLVPGDRPPQIELARRLEAGRALLDDKGCGVCHQMTGVPPIVASQLPVPVDGSTLARGTLLAPDLRYVRDRLSGEALVAWLDDPIALKSDSAMPDLGLSRSEAESIAAYLLYVELEPAEPEPIPERLPLLTREVPFEEVSLRVFRRICWHCHSDPTYGMGDGGPGNTGGFGFEGRSINLAEYQTIMNGYVDADGRRRSLFGALEDGTPRLVAALMARYAELAGEPRDDIRGMPLGLPPLPLEDIQLVESWIDQGRPE